MFYCDLEETKNAAQSLCRQGRLLYFWNTKPFRIRIVNQYNDNHDYFYVKKADASRIYGLELEQLLSPNEINVQVDRDTLVE